MSLPGIQTRNLSENTTADRDIYAPPYSRGVDGHRSKRNGLLDRATFGADGENALLLPYVIKDLLGKAAG